VLLQPKSKYSNYIHNCISILRQDGRKPTGNTWAKNSVMFWSTSFGWQTAVMWIYQQLLSTNLHSMLRNTQPARSMDQARNTHTTPTVHRT